MTVISKMIGKLVSIASKLGGGLSQNENLNLNCDSSVVNKNMSRILRQTAAEGAVLLKNNNNILPLKKGCRVAVFGRNQIDYFYTGYGSGGDVCRHYQVSPLDGLNNCANLTVDNNISECYQKWCNNNPINHGYWAHWPRFYPDMLLDFDFVQQASQTNDCAIYIIGRSSGEDRENALIKGSFYLTDIESRNLEILSKNFKKLVVILNIGSIIDMSWIDKYDLNCVLIAWQGGMESGNAIADVLTGMVNPCGKLTDTIAINYHNYPSHTDFGNKKFNNYTEDIFVGYRYFESFSQQNVAYPFGYGLSYTQFETKCTLAKKTETGVTLRFVVKNIGMYSGKHVVQAYVQKPCDKLCNPSRELVGFIKTDLLESNQEQTLEINIDNYALSSYDDTGASGYPYSYVIQSGIHNFYLGDNVRTSTKVLEYNCDKTQLVKQLKQVAAPKFVFKRQIAKLQNNEYTLSLQDVPTSKVDLKNIILSQLPTAIQITGDKGIKLSHVANKTNSIEDFVAQLDLNQLQAISRGDFTMDSPLGSQGNAGAFGGVTQELRDKGIPPIITTDGPSGIRLASKCSLIPIATLLACTFDLQLLQQLHVLVGKEMLDKKTDVLLSPAMNIHRNPLCGRNFEYMSEDPYLTGMIASSIVQGLQSVGVSACPKHFACNNQEYKRNSNDSRLSERALREIYLKAFEICITISKPHNIMTSYNKINGVWGHYHYELCNRILRQEWNYKGCVITDWWMRSSKSAEFSNLRNNAYRVRSRVNVLMPGGNRVSPRKPDKTLLTSYGKTNGITLGELQQNAIDILNAMLNFPAIKNKM